jgi:hypothetical protein
MLRVGDIVHNKLTRENGRVVRIADLPQCGVAYIVSVILDPNWGAQEKEAVWTKSQIEASDQVQS